jgi:hypothetical protein
MNADQEKLLLRIAEGVEKLNVNVELASVAFMGIASSLSVDKALDSAGEKALSIIKSLIKKKASETP